MQGGQRVPEAYLHDDSVLPHQVRGDLAAVFPRAIAADELAEEPEAQDPVETRGVKIGRVGKAAVNPNPVNPAECLAIVDGASNGVRKVTSWRGPDLASRRVRASLAWRQHLQGTSEETAEGNEAQQG